MKTAACILTLIWGILIIEPAFAIFNSNAAHSSCSKNEPVQSSCSKSKCTKPKKQEDKNDCENNRCNPLMSCPTGNFYLFGPMQLSISPLILAKQKIILVNDNRISKQLTECWHPPEII
jgi:hypothetical protein